MRSINHPSQDHSRFDAMCAGVEDFEPLPELSAAPAEEVVERDGDVGDSSLDLQILAGLVSPY